MAPSATRRPYELYPFDRGAAGVTAPDSGEDETDEDVCGETYDHDTETVYDGPDGYQWTCRRCGAEGWEDADDDEPDNGRQP